MRFLNTLATIALLATAATSQTQLVRGDVDGIQGTNRFQLECTQIPLVSATVNLQALHNASRQQNIDYEMQVVNVGTPAAPVLDVISAVQIPEMTQMGNLRFGRSETWEVFAPTGSTCAVFIHARSATTYLPFGASGTWLLPPSAPLMRQGTAVNGRFRFFFTMPTLPNLVGTEFTAQGLFVDPAGALTITNADCKNVRS